MDMKILKNFIAIAENGSICKAAKELHMSQPPLSKQIKQLEDELNVQLFLRSSRGVVLTEAGRSLYAHATSLVAYSDMIVRELSGDDQTPIRLGMITSSVQYSLDLIKDFFKDDSLRFEITEKNSFELLELLENHIIDLAIIRTPFDMTKPFRYIRLTNDHLVAVGNPSYLGTDKDTISLLELASMPIITVRRWQEYLDANISEFQRSPNYRFICDDNRTSLSLAMNGMGVSILPDSLVNDSIHSKVIEKKLIEGEIFKTSIYAVYSGTRKFNKATTAFLDYLLQKKIDN